MANSDTIELLRECDAGSKMAVSAIDQVLDKAQHETLRSLLSESKQHHTQLGNEIHSILERQSSDDKEPNPMAKGMSWMKTSFKLGMNMSDATIADLMTDGCNMGIKSLNRYLNQYKAADSRSKDICKELIGIEQELGNGMRSYL